MSAIFVVDGKELKFMLKKKSYGLTEILLKTKHGQKLDIPFNIKYYGMATQQVGYASIHHQHAHVRAHAHTHTHTHSSVYTLKYEKVIQLKQIKQIISNPQK